MVRKLIPLILVTSAALGLATGCAGVRDAVAAKSADAADASLESSIWSVCNATTVGALRRSSIGQSKEKLEAFNTLCEGASAGPVVQPKDE